MLKKCQAEKGRGVSPLPYSLASSFALASSALASSSIAMSSSTVNFYRPDTGLETFTGLGSTYFSNVTTKMSPDSVIATLEFFP